MYENQLTELRKSNQKLQDDLITTKQSYSNELVKIKSEKKSVEDENNQLRLLVERLRGNLNIFVRIRPGEFTDSFIQVEGKTVNLTK